MVLIGGRSDNSARRAIEGRRSGKWFKLLNGSILCSLGKWIEGSSINIFYRKEDRLKGNGINEELQMQNSKIAK